MRIKAIVKSVDPEKLVVCKAESFNSAIRFYFNDEQYVEGRDNNDRTISIHYGEEQEEIHEKNAKNIGLVIIFAVTLIIIFAVTLMGYYILVLKLKNILLSWGIVQCFLVGVVIIDMIASIIIVRKHTNTQLRSKHSAEHMIINFLEKNRRLPKNMSEIKNTTRFCRGCGNRKLVLASTGIFVLNDVTVTIAAIGQCIFQNDDILWIIEAGLISIILMLDNKLEFIIRAIQIKLSYILQCYSTIKNVQEEDIILAYYVAREWFQEVYPEFYNEAEDVFEECL